MARYMVITPEFSWVDVILDDGTGPTFYERDVVEIEADTKRDAIALGVRYMLSKGREFQWCRDARSSGESPYAGVKAELMPKPCRACEGTGYTGAADNEICNRCQGSGCEVEH